MLHIYLSMRLLFLLLMKWSIFQIQASTTCLHEFLLEGQKCPPCFASVHMGETMEEVAVLDLREIVDIFLCVGVVKKEKRNFI